MKFYFYGMRLRGFSIGCQPRNNFYRRLDDKTKKYHDIIIYTEPLSNDEIEHYSLDFLKEETI